MCFDLWMRMPLAIVFIDEVDAITGGARFNAQSGVDPEVHHNILMGF
jgi:ATP-dependent 26S proteasome regulatory subunit